MLQVYMQLHLSPLGLKLIITVIDIYLFMRFLYMGVLFTCIYAQLKRT